MTWKLKLFAVLATLAILASTWYIGYKSGSNISSTAISQYETKLAKLKAEKAKVQTVIQTKVVTEYIEKRGKNEEVVAANTITAAEVTPVPTISNGFVYVHDQTIKGVNADPVLAADATPSQYQAQVLPAVLENIRICKNNEIRVQMWIDWYDQTYKSYLEQTNEK